MERLRASAWCVFLVWEGAREGMLGTMFSLKLSEMGVAGVDGALVGLVEKYDGLLGSATVGEGSREMSGEVMLEELDAESS